MDELLKKARQAQWVEAAKENLCYRGRIMRGMELAAKAQADGDKALCEKLKAAIVAMEEELDQLEQKILQAGGGTVEPCDCRYCTQNKDLLYMAESRLRRAVFSLTEPDMDTKVPDTLAAYQAGQVDIIRQLAEKVAAAQHNYFVVCQQFNVTPAWGQILKAW